MVALRAVCVFCGSSSGSDPALSRSAQALGRGLAERGIDLVYGGASVGLMGTVADAALAAGGRVVGVIPRGLFTREIAHRGLTELHEVASMHERKALMYDRSDAFVALPGGFGTLDELFEAVTWSQLGLHAKPAALLDVDGFWEPLVAQLDRMVERGLLRPQNRALLSTHRSVPEVLEHLEAAEPVAIEKWITADER
ncbi:MAG: TIGR00730 family Rossman fold protein [Acidimicrobiia bacterium]